MMIEIRSVLCPIDFSDFSRNAVDHARAVAHRYGAGLTVLHVCPGLTAMAYAAGAPPIEPSVLTDVDREQLIVDLRQFARSGQTPAVPLEAVVREGDVVQEILDQAAAQDADLLCLGTHGRSGFERLLLGSVAEKLLRKARCPVLTVPLHPGGPAQAGSGVYKRVLCPIDFSDCSMAALRYAMSIAQENDAELLVLYAVENDLTPLPGQMPDNRLDRTMSIADFFIVREAHVRQLLKDAVPEAVRNYCAVETVLVHGKPSAEILRLSRERGSDLIVIGVQGRGAVDLTVFGSTTQQVVRQAGCPVLTIRRG